MAKSSFDPALAETVIGHGLHVKGNLECQNDLWLDGTIDGNITAVGNVTVGVNGKVNGYIKAAVITIAGQVKGDLAARDTLVVEGSANIIGDIKCESLSVAEGAAIHGQVTTTRHHGEPSESDAGHQT